MARVLPRPTGPRRTGGRELTTTWSLPQGAWEDVGLTIAAHTLGDDCSFAERVRAAADAGFGGIGLRAENYVAARDSGLSDADLRAILAHHNVRVTEVEFIDRWASTDDASHAKERLVLHMARAFGVGHVNVGLAEPAAPADVRRGLGELARRAGDLVVALEFLPYGAVSSLRAAGDLLDVHPRIALLIDIWHWVRGDTSPGDLKDIPGERFVALQLCDVRATPMAAVREEALHHRLIPGEGVADIAAVLEAIGAAGARPDVISVEVASDALRSLGHHQAASVVATALF